MGLRKICSVEDKNGVSMWVNTDKGSVFVNINDMGDYSIIDNKKRYSIEYKGELVILGLNLEDSKKKAREILESYI